jgi:serine/threonine-protein kinase
VSRRGDRPEAPPADVAIPFVSSVEETLAMATSDPSPEPPPSSNRPTLPRAGAPAPDAPPLPPRYQDLGRLASGSFGEVRRVLDTALDRTVAMKILHADYAGHGHTAARFLAEAKLTAGLMHPGIVAVHDWGQLEDGRLWFTMREVRGQTLGEVIDELHAGAPVAGVRETRSGWTFRRCVDAFARVCQAVAYAHRRGIVHRDLKPDNIMVGELGDVLVMDWGLGRRMGAPEDAVPDRPPPGDGPAHLTQHGDVLGTPAYMPPEQALGQRELHGPPSDVYALGGILYHLLCGRPPYRGDVSLVLAQLITGPPPPVIEVASPRRISIELAAICERAMRREIHERYPHAEALADDVVAWLDGVRRREQALAVVERAAGMAPEIAALRARAAGLRVEAAAALDGVRPFDPIERKRPGWALEDEAARLDVAATLREAERLEALHGALTVDPDLAEAHAALADHYRDRLLEAERAHREAEAARAEAQLRTHDRGRHVALLRGEGALTLVTDPPGAEVRLERYVLRDRRLVAEDAGPLGTTPIRAARLPKGSYRLIIRAPGRAEVRYPVLIERGEHWDGRPPGEAEPCPIWLPEAGELAPDDCYVPAGWCRIGGDPAAAESLPERRLWIDAYVVRRSPVTNREYLAFLDDLVAQGREEEALAACPRPQPSMPQAVGELIYARGADGRFALAAVPGDAGGRVWQPDWPVVLVDWHAAAAYARWLAAQGGRPWRLPNELEREKAARGADGRCYPWGDHFDATWACVLDSFEDEPARCEVDRYPLDESPYGVRGLAGNVRDWCDNVWTREGPDAPAGRLRLVPAAEADGALRAVRGGAWTSPADLNRAAARFASRPAMRWRTTGLRLACSLRAVA